MKPRLCSVGREHRRGRARAASASWGAPSYGSKGGRGRVSSLVHPGLIASTDAKRVRQLIGGEDVQVRPLVVSHNAGEARSRVVQDLGRVAEAITRR